METKKRTLSRGRPLSVYVQDELREALTDFCSNQRIIPDFSAVVRRALVDFLASEGYWPPRLRRTESAPEHVRS